MMRMAALYDIHGNLPALEAVIAEIRAEGIDAIVVGGDVFPGPLPRESLEYLLGLDLPVHFIQGNGDREVLARMRGEDTGTVPEQFRPGIDWVAEQLQPDYESVLAGWPPTCRLRVDSVGDVLFCHATPRSDTEVFTRLTPDERLIPIFGPAGAAVVVCGHTHMQFDRMVGMTRVVNAGSVGMPFGEPGAYWLRIGPDVQLRHTPYDFVRAAGRVRQSGFPEARDFASHNILEPPSERDMLDALSRAELR